MGKVTELKSVIESTQKILGYTESGKAVHNVFKPGMYSDFDKQDHLDAASILGKESWKLSQFQQKDKDSLASEYSKLAMLHTNQYKKK